MESEQKIYAFTEKAIELAKQHKKEKKQSIAAIITDGKGNIISTGVNSYTQTHPVQALYAEKTKNRKKCFLHAEIAALVKCRETPHSIFIARVNFEGLPVLAKPCEICSMALKESNIKLIYYTGDHRDICKAKNKRKQKFSKGTVKK